MKYRLAILISLAFLSCNQSVTNHYTSEIDSLSFLIKKDSLDITLLTKRADLYFENNNFKLAQLDIDNAYSIFKNSPSVLLTRGDIYYALNKTRISKESWERCLQVDPNNIQCRSKLTNLLCAVRDSSCKSMINTMFLLQNGLLSTSLIAYLKELKEYDSSIQLLNNILKKDSTNIEALSLLSVIYSDTSQHNNFFSIELAERCFEKIIELQSNYFQVYYNYGKHKQNILEYSEALLYYTKAIELNNLHQQTYYNMGFCSMQLEDYQQAINYFTLAINIDSSFLLAYHARAYSHELLQNKEKANLDWKNCLLLNPSYIPALEGLNK
jgi:tetratricopeptide (TPR) repeat protein